MKDSIRHGALAVQGMRAASTWADMRREKLESEIRELKCELNTLRAQCKDAADRSKMLLTATIAVSVFALVLCAVLLFAR
jgi:hypothetical protein